MNGRQSGETGSNKPAHGYNHRHA